MEYQTDWDQLEQTAQSFVDSRWPHIGEGILALLPLLKAEPALQPALIYTSMGTLIVEAAGAPKIHIEVLPSGEYKVYWYGDNPLDYAGDVNQIITLNQVVPTVLSKIVG